MNNTAQTILDIERDLDNHLKQSKIIALQRVAKETVKGLCMNCSHFSGCTFPMRGRAFFCDEYE